MLSSKFLFTLSGFCLAFSYGESQEFATNFETEATVAIGLGWDSQGDEYPALFEIGVTSHTEKIMDNGSEIGIRFTLRGSHDNPNRVSGGGHITSLGTAVLSGIHTDVKFSSERSETVRPRARIETAFAYIDGGYGELSVGRDIGVATRLFEGPQSIFSHVRDTDAILDPSGLTISRSRLDWSGNSTKVSYVTPRLVGVRFGLSFTPKTDTDGLDRSTIRSLGRGLIDIWEAGLNYVFTERKKGLRLRAGFGYSVSNVVEELTNYATKIDGWSSGVRIEGRDLSFGISFTSAEEGRLPRFLPSIREDRSEVWSAGLERKAFRNSFSATFANLNRESDRLSSTSWSAGMKREIAKEFFVGVGLQGRRIKLGEREVEGIGGILEITQRW